MKFTENIVSTLLLKYKIDTYYVNRNRYFPDYKN